MKKIFIVFITLSFLLSGCSKKESEHPYEIITPSGALSYFDAKDEIPLKEFKIIDNDQEAAFKIRSYNDNRIVLNENGVIRCIYITDEDIKTYKQISVGDSVDKIKDTFEYEDDSIVDNYTVIFDANTDEEIDDNRTQKEIDDDIENGINKRILVTYCTDGSKIESILIADDNYANCFQ